MHAPESYISHLVCQSVILSIDLSTLDLSDRLVFEVPNQSRQHFKGKQRITFSSFSLIFEKKTTELRPWSHAQSSAHPVLFGKRRCIVVFYHRVYVSFLYLSCSAIMDSPGGEFNSYKSKRLGQI